MVVLRGVADSDERFPCTRHVLTRVGTLFFYCTAEVPGLTVLGTLKIFSPPTQSTLVFVWLHDTV